MDHGKEFKKYAIQHHGINSLYYDQLVSSMTPYIIEERQMNVAQMDVFSRLMIFLYMGCRSSIENMGPFILEMLEASRFNVHLFSLPSSLEYSHPSTPLTTCCPFSYF